MIIIACLLLLVVTSCSTVSDVKQEIEPLTEIAVGEAMAKRDSVMLSDYASSIDYVPLESHPEALLTTRDYETINGPGGEKVPAKKYTYSGIIWLSFYLIPDSSCCLMQMEIHILNIYAMCLILKVNILAV